MKSKYSELSDSLTPEKVLQQFAIDSEHPVNQMNNWSITLYKSTEMNEKLKLAAQIHKEAEAMLEYVYSIIDYLREPPKTEIDRIRSEENLSDITKIPINSFSAYTILSRFTHELRHPMTVIVSYSHYYQKSHMRPDEQQEMENSLIETIEHVKSMCVWLQRQLGIEKTQ